jgi:D-glycero-D-manno-heptose 1,7-bisphosphate phosphatase
MEIQKFNYKSFPRHLIFDRDSTLITDSGYTFKIENLKFLPGALDALKLAKELEFMVSIATNQSGVGRGFFSVDEMKTFNDQLRESILVKTGLGLAYICSCTHTPEDFCSCRKPNSTMLEELIHLSGVPKKFTAFFGNAQSDFIAGQRAGIFSKISFGNRLYKDILELRTSFDN